MITVKNPATYSAKFTFSQFYRQNTFKKKSKTVSDFRNIFGVERNILVKIFSKCNTSNFSVIFIRK